jgi:outer membrane protein
VSAFALACAWGAAVHAETLADAIALAYQNNPTLQQQRAILRGLDENYVQAASGLRPTVTTQVYGTYQEQRFGRSTLESERIQELIPDPATKSQTNTATGQIVVQQPLFTGGRVASQIQTAKEQISAGRQGLRAAEGDLILNVVEAYASVRRDQAIVDVWRASVEQFLRQLDEAQARQAAGDATKTDVEQARAQLEQERASYAAAVQQLQASRASYALYVGQNPGALAPMPALPNLPKTVDEAFDRAENTNPELAQAILAEATSRAEIAEAKAAYRPTVSAQASYGYTGTMTPLYARDLERDLTAQVVVSQPLFTGGLNASNVRRALEQNNADRNAIEITRRQVVQNIANAWNQMLTARTTLDNQARQVVSARATYVGMQEEYRAGQRSTFDVLYAEEVLRDAQIQLMDAQHDAYVGEAAVIRYAGGLEASRMVDGVPQYDPAANTRRVARDGGLPWDSLVQGMDALAAPRGRQTPLEAPPLAENPYVRQAHATIPADAPLSTVWPVQPILGSAADTVTPQLPMGSGSQSATQTDSMQQLVDQAMRASASGSSSK